VSYEEEDTCAAASRRLLSTSPSVFVCVRAPACVRVCVCLCVCTYMHRSAEEERR